MNLECISKQVQRYNAASTQSQRDDALYQIGTHADIFTDDEASDWSNEPTPELRCQVLEWLIAETSFDVREDIHPLIQIFGEEYLREALQECRQRYPDFDLVMGVRFSEVGDVGFLEMSMHFEPRAGACLPDPDENDFPVNPFWDLAEMYFFESQGCSDDLEFTLYLYPDQASFASEGSDRIANQEYIDLRSLIYDDEDLVKVEDLLGQPVAS